MSDNRESTLRLKKALESVVAPPGLESAIRARIRTNERLRRAVESVPVPPFLETRVRNRVKSSRKDRPHILWMAPVAAAIVLATVSVAYQHGHLRFTRASREAYAVSLLAGTPSLLGVGLGDHVHCSVFRKFPKEPPGTEQFLKTMDAKFAGLIPIVRSQAPERYRLMLAHECRYHGRRFVHLSLSDSSNLMSLIVTKKAPGESFQAARLLPALVESGIPMYRAGAQRFQISGFETRDYLVYIVSDLPARQNTDMMLALGPRVKSFLAGIEL